MNTPYMAVHSPLMHVDSVNTAELESAKNTDRVVRLSNNLARYNRVAKDVGGDGDCQFLSVADQLQTECDRQVPIKTLRNDAVKWIREHFDDTISGPGFAHAYMRACF